FTFSLASVWRGRPVISRLVLVDGTVDLERRADGLRNWRLRDPEDPSPGRVTVMTFEPLRAQVRFVNRAIDLDFVATAAPAEVRNGDALSTRITYQGRYQQSAFSGEALSGSVLSFRDSGMSFPLRGRFVSRATRLDFDGFFTDIFDLGPMDARLRLAGPSLSLVHPFVRARPPESRPYTFEAQLTQTRKVFHFAQLAGKIGGTPIAGDVVYDHSAARPVVKAALHSDAADFDDIRPLLGMRGAARPARSDTPRSANASDEADDEKDRGYFPTRAFRLGGFRSFDLRVAATLKKLAVPGFRTLDDVRVDAKLTQGVLELKPVELQLAGGRVTGSATFDGREDAASASISGELRGIRIERLVPALGEKAGSAGALDGHVAMSGRGVSIAAIVGSSAGAFAAAIEQGRISNLTDAKLGLDFGKVVSVFLRGDREIAINCGAAAFDVRDGVAKSTKIVLDTEQTHVVGRGTILLRDEELDLLLTPEPKKPGLFTRRASVRIKGPLRRPAVSVVERLEQAGAAAGGC
ncbi:MAG TPA: AsmA family protein, partial [Burkholderiales bacterium]|nr:AsmA family protein [Burkholderiales bacterium]